MCPNRHQHDRHHRFTSSELVLGVRRLVGLGHRPVKAETGVRASSHTLLGHVAQLAERPVEGRVVAGSNPAVSIKQYLEADRLNTSAAGGGNWSWQGC